MKRLAVATLGIDLGTGSVKVLILDIQGQLLSTSRADYEIQTPRPGWAESDPAAWWSATVSAVRTAIAQAPQAEVAAIGLAGQMHGIVPVDEEGKPTRAAMLWADNRAEAELERYHALPASTLQRLANPLVPGMAGPLLCWLARHETSSYQATRWALQPKDWLRWCLTEAIATDPSDASATLLYDLPGDHQADDVIAALELRRDLFPPILPSGARVAVLSTYAADMLGLPAGLPMATGAGDTPAAAMGTGLLVPGPIQLTLGTGAQVMQLRPRPVVDQTRRTHLYRAADGANWYAMAAVQNAGLALDRMRRVLHASWDELYASAATVAPGSAGLIFLPYLTRERPHHSNPHSSGAFLGMRINHEREHLLHATLEGVAFGIRAALDALPGEHTTNVLRLAGGGSEHPAWRQMIADILHHELVAVDVPAASARGAALLAGIAGGLWADAAATSLIAPRTHTIATPDPQRMPAYDEAYARFLSVCEMDFTLTPESPFAP